MSFSSRFPGLAILAFVVLMHGLALRHWVTQDTRPVAWDQAIHTQNAFEYRDRLRNEPLSQLFRPIYFDYPPLYHLQLIPFLNCVSDVANAGSIVNFFYLCLLIVCIFFIGEHLFGRWEGLTASILFSCYPFVGTMATQTLIDLSLTGWVTLCVLCLLKSGNFSKVGWTLGFGAALGLGALTKWSAPVYLVGPLIPVLFASYRRKTLRWFFAAMILALVFVSLWYPTNFIPALTRVHGLTNLPPADGSSLQGFLNAMWYPIGLIEQLNAPFLLLFIPGLFVVFWRPNAMVLLLWLVMSLVLFSVIRNHNIRYSLPVLPAVALLSVAWLPPKRRVPYILVQIGAIGFFLIPHLFPHIQIVRFVGSQPIWLMKGNPPYAHDWKHGPIIDRIRELKNPDEKLARVVVVSNHPHFHSTSLNVSLRVRDLSDVTFYGVGKRRWFEFADFILLKTGDVRADFAKNVQDVADYLKAPPAWFGHVFKEVGRWPLPEESEGVLYQCRPDPVEIPDVGIFNLWLDELNLPNIHATKVQLKATPLSQADTPFGRLKELRVRCKRLEYKSVRFDDVEIRLLRPQVNLPLFFATQEIQLDSLDALEPHATIATDTLLAFAREKAPWLKQPSIHVEGSMVDIAGKVGVLPLELGADVRVENRMFRSRLLKMKIAKIPFPRIFMRAFSDQNIDLNRNEDLAYDLTISGIRAERNVLRIGS